MWTHRRPSPLPMTSSQTRAPSCARVLGDEELLAVSMAKAGEKVGMAPTVVMGAGTVGAVEMVGKEVDMAALQVGVGALPKVRVIGC